MDLDGILCDAFLVGHPAEAARAIERCSLPAVAAFLSDCAPESLGPVVAAMDPAAAAAAMAEVDEGHGARIVHALPQASAGILLRRLTGDLRERLLERMPPRVAARIRARLRYPPGTAGDLLDPLVLTAPPELTVAETLDRLRRTGARGHSHVFVTDADGVLVGACGLGELLTAASDAPLGGLARGTPPVIQATAEGEAVRTHPAWSALLTPPVVDRAGRLLGVMRHERILGTPTDERPPAGAAAAALEVAALAWSAGIAAVGALVDALDPPRRSPTQAEDLS